MKINKDFIKIFIHQIDNRPNYSFTSSQLCLRSVKWIFFIDQVFEIESCRLGRWVSGSVVGWLVGWWVSGRWSVGRWSVGQCSVDLIKTQPGQRGHHRYAATPFPPIQEHWAIYVWDIYLVFSYTVSVITRLLVNEIYFSPFKT